MSTALEAITKQAVDLPPHQRLALARFLIEMDDSAADEDVQQTWDTEISERVRAAREGRTEGIPYEEVLARVDRRLAPGGSSSCLRRLMSSRMRPITTTSNRAAWDSAIVTKWTAEEAEQADQGPR